MESETLSRYTRAFELISVHLHDCTTCSAVQQYPDKYCRTGAQLYEKFEWAEDDYFHKQSGAA